MSKPHYKVLIVDDSPDDRAVCKRYLQRDPDRDYTIWEEELSRKGIVASQLIQPDCILVDYRFPDIDGLQFLSQLQVLTGEQAPAVVMLTGSGHEGVAVKAMKQGAQDYLVKDALTQESLWRAVGNAIESVKLRRGLDTQRSEAELLRAAVQQATDAIMITTSELDPPGPQITFVNSAFTAMTGYAAEEVLGKTPRILHGPNTDRAVLDRLRADLTAGRAFAGETINYRKDGSEFILEWCATPLRDGRGRITHFVATQRDVTARKQAEEVLRQQAEIIDQIHDAVIATDLEGRVTSWNKGAERLFGYTAAEMLDHSVLRLFPEDLQSVLPAIVETLRKNGQHELEIRQRRKSGGECDVHLSLSLRRDQWGTPMGMIGYALDITSRKQAEAAVQSVNEELQQFAYIVSHDLSEPLRTMSNYMALLARRYKNKLDATAEEYINFAVNGAQRLQQMITDLLAYTRAGGQDLTMNPVDCNALLAQVCNDLHLIIRENDAAISHDPLPTVYSDATRLGQVLQNLIGNALKFRSAAAPQVHVSGRREGQWWRFSVRDNGIGIDPSQATRLFQVFQRLHTRSEYQGTGIGLAICKKIVEQHGGRIWVESAPGAGATFYFTIRDKNM